LNSSSSIAKSHALLTDCKPGSAQGWTSFHSMLWQFLVGSQWCTHVSTCACLCSSLSYFGTHLAQILISKVLVYVEYANPQVMSNLLAISKTVIYLSSWTRTLTQSTLSVHEVVGWPKQSSSAMLVLPLWNLSTHWYTFCIKEFPLYCTNILQCIFYSTLLNYDRFQVELTCLYYDCMCFTDHNRHTTTCLDLALYVVCVISTKVQYDKLPGLYMQISLTFQIPIVVLDCF
jgi:hypothetical protein